LGFSGAFPAFNMFVWLKNSDVFFTVPLFNLKTCFVVTLGRNGKAWTQGYIWAAGQFPSMCFEPGWSLAVPFFFIHGCGRGIILLFV
jgi:hypothetical protein